MVEYIYFWEKQKTGNGNEKTGKGNGGMESPRERKFMSFLM